MRLSIAAIGRLKERGEIELTARYQKRIDQTGRALALGPLLIVELPEARQPDAAQRKADEAARLITTIARSDRRVVLDEGGKQLNSNAFADLLQNARDDGAREMAFLIGGPDGHGTGIRDTADIVLSLSAMTLPHGLARAMLAEQIYRALTIISGHPYHRA